MTEVLYQSDYWLSTYLIQRGIGIIGIIGIIYLIAFLGAINQFRPLLGEEGLLPVPQSLDDFRYHFD